MKYFLVLIAIIVLAPWRLPAQIVLDSAGYPSSVIGSDSLKVTTSSSPFPVLNAAANGTWDLSVITDSAWVNFAYRVSDLPYEFADSSLLNILGYDCPNSKHSGILANGLSEYGRLHTRTAYSLYALTVNPFDSLIIPSQNNLYSSPHIKIAFPATYNSSWNSSYYSDIHFLLSYLANGDTLAPGIVRTYITEKDTVTGWGKMRIPDANGIPSPYLNVLQVQTKIIRTDSFFLKGVPFSLPLLTIFGLTQGQRDTTYEQNYYRLGELTPLAQVEFHDSAYTQPYKATTHVQRLSAVSVPSLAGNREISIFPNPCVGTVIIDIPSASGKWTYQLTSATGQSIISGELPVMTGKIHSNLLLPASTATGTYYLHISNNNKPVAVKTLTLRSK